MKTNFAFIDSQNLNLGVKSQGWNLDWRKFRIYIKEKYNITKAFLFIGYVEGNSPLYQFLQTCGFILIFKPTFQRMEKGKPVTKGNVDAELVFHSMIEFNNYSKAIIVSGDGDFHCLIKYLSGKDKLLKVLTPTKHYSSLLRKFSFYITRLDLLRSSLENKKTGIHGRSKPQASPVIVI